MNQKRGLDLGGLDNTVTWLKTNKQTENHLFFIINFHSSWVVEKLARKNKEKLKYMENKPLELSHNFLDASRF